MTVRMGGLTCDLKKKKKNNRKIAQGSEEGTKKIKKLLNRVYSQLTEQRQPTTEMWSMERERNKRQWS